MSKDKRSEIEQIDKINLHYAIYRLVIGALIGFTVTLLLGYFWACYKNNISLETGFSIFGYPIVGLGLTVVCFFGAVVGAIAGLFSKKWKEKNL